MGNRQTRLGGCHGSRRCGRGQPPHIPLTAAVHPERAFQRPSTPRRSPPLPPHLPHAAPRSAPLPHTSIAAAPFSPLMPCAATTARGALLLGVTPELPCPDFLETLAETLAEAGATGPAPLCAAAPDAPCRRRQRAPNQPAAPCRCPDTGHAPPGARASTPARMHTQSPTACGHAQPPCGCEWRQAALQRPSAVSGRLLHTQAALKHMHAETPIWPGCGRLPRSWAPCPLRSSHRE